MISKAGLTYALLTVAIAASTGPSFAQQQPSGGASGGGAIQGGSGAPGGGTGVPGAVQNNTTDSGIGTSATPTVSQHAGKHRHHAKHKSM